MKTIVIVDFDETLVYENTLLPLFKALSKRSMSWVVLKALSSFQWLKIGFHEAIKAQMHREILAGHQEKVIVDTAKKMAATINVNFLVATKLDSYRDTGAVIVIASASLDLFVATLLAEKDIQVDRVIGSIGAQDGGVYTGELLTGECVGKRKAERSKQMLDKYYRGYRVIAWGNLPADRALMKIADEAYVVNGRRVVKFTN